MPTWFKLPYEKQLSIADTSYQQVDELSIDNRGLAYADGFFSTMGISQGDILWFDYHIKRLISHANSLQLELNIELLTNQLYLVAQSINEGILKVIVTRKSQNVKGYGFINGEVDVFMKQTKTPMPAYQHIDLDSGEIPTQQIAGAVCLSAQIACLPKTLVGLKSLNRLDSVLVAREFEKVKHSKRNTINIVEGLVADITGHWVEGVMSNLFYQLSDNQDGEKKLGKNTWFTPPIDSSGVAGVMRAVIIDKMSKDKRPVQQRYLTSIDLPNLTSLFFCNAVCGIQPISQLYLPNGDIHALTINTIFQK